MKDKIFIIAFVFLIFYNLIFNCITLLTLTVKDILTPSSYVEACDGIVACYYGAWTIYRPGRDRFGVRDIPADLCTHIIYSFIAPNADGTVFMLHEEVTVGGKSNKLSDLARLKKRNPDLKVLVALGGWNAGCTNFTIIANNETLRTTFVNNLYDFVVENDLDGVDFDWEYPAQRGGVEADKELFVLMVKELKEKFGDLLVTAAVAATQYYIDMSYNVSGLNRYLDYFFLMSYDLHGVWSGVTGANAPLYSQLTDPVEQINLSINTSVHTWIENGASPEKIVVGVATYGRTFTLASLNNTKTGAPITGAGVAGPRIQAVGTYAYHEICEDQQANPRQWNITKVAGNYVYANKNLFWVGYDDADTIKAKGQYAKDKGLAGMMFWSVDQDDYGGDCGSTYPLIKAARNGYCGESTDN